LQATGVGVQAEGAALIHAVMQGLERERGWGAAPPELMAAWIGTTTLPRPTTPPLI
jgi:hypothetical protein